MEEVAFHIGLSLISFRAVSSEEALHSLEICIDLVSQVTLHLGLGLHLETSTWLSSPVFMEKSVGGRAADLKVEARGWSLQPAPGK